MEAKQPRYLPESKDYFSKNVSSWYVKSSSVGSTGYCSMTFVDYIQKVHLNESNKQMGGDTDLIAEAVCNITLTAENAIHFAKAILNQFGVEHSIQPPVNSSEGAIADMNESPANE